MIRTLLGIFILSTLVISCADKKVPREFRAGPQTELDKLGDKTTFTLTASDKKAAIMGTYVLIDITCDGQSQEELKSNSTRMLTIASNEALIDTVDDSTGERKRALTICSIATIPAVGEGDSDEIGVVGNIKCSAQESTIFTTPTTTLSQKFEMGSLVSFEIYSLKAATFLPGESGFLDVTYNEGAPNCSNMVMSYQKFDAARVRDRLGEMISN